MVFGVLLCYRCYVSGYYGLRSTGVGFGGLRCLWRLPHCLDLVVLGLLLGYLCWLIVVRLGFVVLWCGYRFQFGFGFVA